MHLTHTQQDVFSDAVGDRDENISSMCSFPSFHRMSNIKPFSREALGFDGIPADAADGVQETRKA